MITLQRFTTLPSARALILGLAVSVASVMTSRAGGAQDSSPIPIESIETFIARAHMTPQKLWDLFVSKRGLAFAVDAAAERHLREIGADDDMIAMLKRATVQLPPPRPPVLSSARPIERAAPRMSRSELRWVYFNRKGGLSTYVTAAKLQETAGQVRGESMTASDGSSIALESVPLRQTTILGGIVVHYADYGLMIEGHFQPDLLMINMGLSYEPFLPLGSTGFRAILGGAVFLGDTRQIIGQVPRAPGDTAYWSIELHNAILGGDARVGLAYHFRPGVWAFAERSYRMEITVKRQLEVPGEQTVTEGIPWSKWSARGGMWRFGIGW